MKYVLLSLLFAYTSAFAGSFCIVSVPNGSCPAGNIAANFPQTSQNDFCCKNMNGANGVTASQCYFPTPNAQGNHNPFANMNECKRATPPTNPGNGGIIADPHCASSKLCSIQTQGSCSSTSGCYWFSPKSMCCAQ